MTGVQTCALPISLRTYYRNRQQTVIEAEQRGMPIYVLRANTVAQVEQFLSDLYSLSAQTPRDTMDDIRSETQQAISAVLNGERWVDLPPGPSLVRRLQHEMARGAELVSHSYGKEPRRHVRIFRVSTSKMDNEPNYHKQSDEIGTLDMNNMAEIIKSIAISSKTIVSGKDTPSRVEKEK